MIPDIKWLSDPEVFEVNREKAHSDHSYTVNGKECKKLLNGTWKFSYADAPKCREADFYKNDYSVSEWQDIAVPAHIQLEGWGKPQYTNIPYPWEGREALVPPQIPTEYNPVGSYVTFFDIEKEYSGMNTYISFQGVECAFYLWVNGEFVGYSEDSFTPSEFDITPYVKEKDNRLSVEVYRFSTASWLEDQDFWRFSGIFRDVYLYFTPSVHVRDIKATAEYDYINKKGILSVEADVIGKSECNAEYTLFGQSGEQVYSSSSAPCKAVIENILPWSAESPSLYRLEIKLYSENGFLAETASTYIGFRTFEMKDGIMHLNGKRIIFNGVNRHEFGASKGRVISTEDMLWDIRFMKQHNINAVRTSHYPNNSYWYYLCDLYGIYVIDEANLETHGSWANMPAGCIVPDSVPYWKNACVDRAASMLQRDKNHPSVLIWSCGNESHCGDNIAAMSDYFHQNDPTRLVHYEGVWAAPQYDYVSDMKSHMYPKPHEIISYLENSPKKPYVCCEYMHAMGNSLGGMDEYTSLCEKYPHYQGGFIWDYIDQALYNKEGNLCYGGDFGDRTTDYGFCTNGIVYADRKPSPKAAEAKALYSNIKISFGDDTFTVRNNNLFINTEDYDFVLTLEKEGNVIAKEAFSHSISPQSEYSFSITANLPEEAGEYVYTVTVLSNKDTLWAKAGHEIAFGQNVIYVNGEKRAQKYEKPVLVKDILCTGIHGKNFSVMFDKREGGITSLVYGKTEYITRTPKVIFWRAPTDNDNGAGTPQKSAMWYLCSRYAVHCPEKFCVEEKEDSYVVSFAFTTPCFDYTVSYTVFFNGSIGVRVCYPGADNMSDMPVFAMDFRMKKELSQFTYYGMGPQENYPDRAFGARLGVFSSCARENLSAYLNPQECGNRTGVRYVSVYGGDNSGVVFEKTDAVFDISVLPYSAYELENALHLYELPNPSYTWVRIAAKQTGVGGIDSWGSPVQPKYRIGAKEPIKLEFVIKPKA